jgi:sarcosine oxidase
VVVDDGSFSQSTGLGRIFRIAHRSERLAALAREARERWLQWEDELGERLLGEEGLVVAGAARPGASERITREQIRERIPHADAPWEEAVWDGLAGSLRIRRAQDALRARVPIVRATVTAVGDVVQTTAGDLHPGAVVVCAGIGTPGLVAPLGIDLGLSWSPHIRVTYEPCPPTACLISPECYALPLGTTGRWALGMHHDARDDEWVRRVFPGLRAVGEIECVSLRADWLAEGDGFRAWRAGRVIALGASNAMKFGPLIGDRLAASALEESGVHPDLR